MDKITFCIPSKSNLRYLKTCIPSIRNNARRDDHDIIVFVDSDEDGTIEWLNQVKDKYNISIQDKRAYILNNKSVYFLEKTQHIISIKSSGTNYFMFFTNLNNVNYCFFIDRKIKQGYTYPRIILIDYSFDTSVYNDTLLDGEMIKDDKGNWMFLISDLIINIHRIR